MTRSIKVNHLARVEGHGGVTVEMDGRSVSSVRFDIFEGARLLEALARGRHYTDVPQIVSRICAICSVSHSISSIKATESAFGVTPTPQTELLRDLLYRGEDIESHSLHVFCLAVPDYLNYPSVVALAADHPDAARLGLRLKKLGNTIQEVIGGRAVHPVNVLVGGFGKLPTADQLMALRDELHQAAEDSKSVVDLIASLPPADYCSKDTVFAALRPKQFGYGYYSGDQIHVRLNGKTEAVPAAEYRSLANERAVPHSHAKHSQYKGRPFMVGALARLTVNSDLLNGSVADVKQKFGLNLPSGNPMDNNKAQALELVYDIHRSLETVEKLLADGLREEAPVPVRPKAGSGTGVTEAPRGMLVHSYSFDGQGRLATADVITPTAFNAASVEEHLRRAVEQNAGDDDAALTKKLEMIVRAYDPCISCSVHLVRRRNAP
ncbi:MAG: Ni/Fe hydrogenase subunit alpha [Bryobacterales bacterium]|nr:Ni/Fe hydrogenase subunit alpha [Bryobacterales bacterium]